MAGGAPCGTDGGGAAPAARGRRRAALRVAAALVSAVSAGAAVAAGDALAQEAGARLGLRLDDEGIVWRGQDGGLVVNLGGRLHLDAGGGEAQGAAALDEASLWRGTVRRAWAELGATYGEAWSFGLQLDASARREVVRDLALGYSGLRPFLFTVGNFKEPISFEQLQSSNNITFIERSLADSVVPSRRFGAAAGAQGERWTAALGVFGSTVNDQFGTGEGVAVAGRATYAPVLEGPFGRVLHFGVSGGHRWTERGAGFGLRPDPESSVYDVPLVGFGALLGVRAVARGGVEAAYRHGPYRLQAEYIAARAERDGGGEGEGRRRDAVFHGGYVQVAAVLAGRPRPYRLPPGDGYGSAYAVFGGVEIAEEDTVGRGGAGAWEVAARYSFLDLDAAGVGGGRQHNVTAGVNWHPEAHMRLMLNYVRAFGDDLTTDGGRGADATADIVQVRFQIAY